MPTDGETYYPYKIDYLFKTINASEFMNTLNNVFGDLTDFSKTDNIKVKRVIEDNFEYYERSIFVDKFQMRFEPNSNVYIDYAASRKMFEIQGLEYDDILYFNTEETVDALKYNDNALYNDVVELGFEFVIRYDKGNNVLDKNVYMYMPIIQGGTFTREIDIPKGIKNFKEIAYEKNIFNNPTVVRQFDANNNLIRTYQEVENLSNHNYKYAYEVNNTPEGFIELVFGDGKNSEILLPASKTLLYYRKNALHTEEIFNVKNADLISVSLTCPYYDSNVGKDQSMVLPMYMLDKFNAVNGLPAETDDQIKYMARKLRSVQDRFVTGSDYETAGMLHPRVKYTTVILRTYIGKNSSRMSNEFIDVYFDSFKNEISTYDLADVYTEEITDRFVIVPTACFTESSVTGRYDHLKFVETGDEYYFEIFDADSLPPNEWFKYPEDIISDKSKGTVVKITNKLVDEAIKDVLVDKIRINNILPLEYSIETLEFIGSTSDTLNFNITVNKDLVFEDIETAFTDDKPTILDGYNALITEFTFSDISIVENRDGYTTSVKYSTNDIIMPTNDLSFIWTHYKSDDIFINPSKSNIIEIYVSGMTKNLKKDVEVYEPLTSSEINKLVTEINKRKMISDIVQVYNASTYEIETAIRVHKSKTSKITNELLKSKIDKQLDNFFDISNIPLGTHFYMSRLIEWLHTQIPEIQHIEMLFDEHEQSITPSSTIEVLGERIIFTQIVEKTQEINDVVLPQRTIEIIS